MERYLKKNRNGNYGIFADNCDHCIERPPPIDLTSDESSLQSITLKVPGKDGSRASRRSQISETVA